ncbi:MAG: tetratricopeptide repeat protein, partial [Cyanobacteria bacterium J06632_3]
MMKYLDEALMACETLVAPSTDGATAITANSMQANSMAAESDPSVQWMMACQTVGNILVSMGFVEEANSWQTMALDITPNACKFYEQSGRLYYQCEAWKQAIYFTQRRLECQPESEDVYRQLATAYHRIGDYESERKTIHALLLKRPDRVAADGHHQLGKAMEQYGQYEEAVRCYQQAIDQNSQFSLAYYALSELWLKANQSEQALQLLEQLRQETPEDAMAHYRLGRAYKQNGQLEVAIECFRAALQLDDQLHWAYMGLLNTLMQLDRIDETIETSRGIIHFVGELPWAYCFLANALAQRGELIESAIVHRKAFELRGWQACISRKYVFEQTWFSESIPLWEKHLLPLRDSLGDSWRDSWVSANDDGDRGRRPMRALALGSGDGSAVCWLIDEILQQPDDRLVCITPRASEPLKENLGRLPESNKVTLTVGDCAESLTALLGK